MGNMNCCNSYKKEEVFDIGLDFDINRNGSSLKFARANNKILAIPTLVSYDNDLELKETYMNYSTKENLKVGYSFLLKQFLE